jgi:uncharacterized membrane protein
MFGLTTMGLIHTAISLVAVGAALVALVRDGAITLKNKVGLVYAGTTILTCVTALFIFKHGGFGGPHVLAILTMIVLAVAALAEFRQVFGRLSTYVATVGYSATFLFHMIPALAEGTTRIPASAPIFASPEAQGLKLATVALLLLFLIGAGFQIAGIRKSRA